MSIRRYSFSPKTSRSPRWTNSLDLEKTVYFFFGWDLQYAWTIIRISSIWTLSCVWFNAEDVKTYELYRFKTRVTRNSESKTTLKTNSLDLLFWISDVQNRNIPLIYRTEKTKNMNFQLIFCLNAYLFLCWIWKAFKAHVCPHFSNITHQTHGRHGHFQLLKFWDPVIVINLVHTTPIT
jgi:hypothetical protein